MSDSPQTMVEHYKDLNRDRILNMEPGREMDALVAEKIMGWTECSVDGQRSYGKPPEFVDADPVVRIYEYSTEISAAWGVFEELNGKFGVSLGRAGDYYEPDRKWNTRIGKNEWVEAETAPEAICKAALMAVMDT